MARRPVRTADADRSRSSVDGGMGTISSSDTVRRSRLRAGAFLMGVDSTRRRAAAFLATGRPAVRAAVERFGAFGAAAVTLRPAFLGAAFLGAAFLSAAFLSATVRAALRGAARFFATLLVAALLFGALLLIALLLAALLLTALLFVAAEARRLAAAT